MPDNDMDSNVQTLDTSAPLLRKTIIVLEELPDAPGAFSVGLALSSQDPAQNGGEIEDTTNVVIPVTDMIAMVLVDIVKTTPKAFSDRLETLYGRINAASEAVKAGRDPAEGQDFSAPLGGA